LPGDAFRRQGQGFDPSGIPDMKTGFALEVQAPFSIAELIALQNMS
jgi:hypothetical protein